MKRTIEFWKDVTNDQYISMLNRLLTKGMQPMGLKIVPIRELISPKNLEHNLVRRRITIIHEDFSEVPDIDLVIYHPKEEPEVKAVVIGEIHVRRRLFDAMHIKTEFEKDPVTCHIGLWYISPDPDHLLDYYLTPRLEALIEIGIDEVYTLTNHEEKYLISASSSNFKHPTMASPGAEVQLLPARLQVPVHYAESEMIWINGFTLVIK